MHYSYAQWLVLVLAALGIGLSKTGLPGSGILAIALFAIVVPTQESVGLVLPLLIAGDLTAVASYRLHGDWAQLRRIFPWAGAGVVAGYFAVLVLNHAKSGNEIIAKSVGVIILAMVILQVWRKRHPRDEDLPHGRFWTPAMGLLAGFTTMVANASGPVMIIYLLGMNLPILAFMGTSAWFFFCLNLFKVPFSVSLGLINLKGLPVDACLIPLTLLGGLAGRAILKHLNQEAFETVALTLTVVCGLKLLM